MRVIRTIAAALLATAATLGGAGHTSAQEVLVSYHKYAQVGKNVAKPHLMGACQVTIRKIAVYTTGQEIEQPQTLMRFSCENGVVFTTTLVIPPPPPPPPPPPGLLPPPPPAPPA